jgi:quinoprotein glucose dehydrogenase
VIIKKGGNYGWSIKEGSHEFKGGKPVDEITPPVIEYNHRLGRSITGGHVYRGGKFEKLKGIYFYCDYESGRFWGLRFENGKVTQSGELLEKGKRDIASFGVDSAGELFACCFDGRIYRVEPAE